MPGGTGVAPGVAEDPTRDETMVIANQSGSTVTDNATGQVLLCRGLGGTETVYENRTVGGGRNTVDVYCKGGLLDGHWCANGSGYTICFFRAVLPQDPQVTPTGGIEAPAEDAPTETAAATDVPVMPTEAVTDAPTEPTAVPTDVAAEPTAAPVEDPPVPPTVPTDDNTAPPGEAEDPTPIEPTPTEVVLL